MERMKKHHPEMKWWFDTASLAVFAYYAAFRFLQSTMFDFVYFQTWKIATYALLALTAFFRIISYGVTARRSSANGKAFLKKVLWLFVPAASSVFFLWVGVRQDCKWMVGVPLSLFCLLDIDHRRVLKWFAWTIGVFVCATVACCLTGTVKNLTNGASGRIVGAYGFINTTDFASYFTFLLLCVWCIPRKRGAASGLLLAGVMIAASGLLYWYTASRTAVFCGVLSASFVLLDGAAERMAKRGRKSERLEKALNVVFAGFLPALCVAFFALLALYARNVPLALKADQLLSGRLQVALDAFNKYGIHAFGSQVASMRGVGRTMINVQNWSAGYGYIDSAYMMMFVRYGWAVSLCMIGFWTLTVVRSLRRGDKRIALSMLIIALHAVSEARFLDVNYNVFLVMPLCLYCHDAAGDESGETEEQGKLRRRCAFLAAGIVLAGLFLAIPRAFSWLRTIFYLKGYAWGIHAWGSLLICCGLIVAVIILWRGLAIAFQRKGRKPYALLLGLALIGAGIYAGNAVIEQGLLERREQLAAEQEIVKTVQAAASGPVYAAEQAELYQRRFGGFAEHIFSTDELNRHPQGTIFTGADAEALGIVRSDGLYARISPWSGLYSYDAGVIEALAKEGYEWTAFYSGTRTCDLSDLAARNGLRVNSAGEAVLDGTGRSVFNNLEWDQYAGTYEVLYRFSLSRAGSDPEGKACTVIVMGEAGDRVILEKPVDLADLDAEKENTISLTYTVHHTPGVSYQLIAEDGVQIALKEISWRQISRP